MGRLFTVKVFEAGIVFVLYPITNIDPLMRAVSPQRFSLLLTAYKEVKKIFAFCELSQ